MAAELLLLIRLPSLLLGKIVLGADINVSQTNSILAVVLLHKKRYDNYFKELLYKC